MNRMTIARLEQTRLNQTRPKYTGLVFDTVINKSALITTIIYTDYSQLQGRF